MKKFKIILPCFLILLFLFLIFPIGNAGAMIGSDELLASNYLSVSSAVGYLYDEEQNIDNEIDAKSMGFVTETISDESQWNTPFLRYSEIKFDAQFTGKILGLNFELKTDIASGFEITVEAQIYKEAEHPEGWDDLTQEEKDLWEQENCIQDRQFASTTVRDSSDVYFSFNEEKASVDSSYQVRIIFTSIDEKAITDSTNYLNNFMIDNFFVITVDV